jgi:hypothetical protein
MTSDNLLMMALGAGAAYLLFKRTGDIAASKDAGANAAGTVPSTGLPDNGGGAQAGGDNARQAQEQGAPSNVSYDGSGIMPRGDTVGGFRWTYGFGMGNNVDLNKYYPILVSKQTTYENDRFNSAADNNGGMVIGSGYR